VETPIACSLGAGDLTDRLAQWRRLLTSVTSTTRGAGSHEVVLDFGVQTPVAEIAALCADEVSCCAFFTFELAISATAVRLRICVPVGAETTLSEFLQLLPASVP
jgi:hypothetical protein